MLENRIRRLSANFGRYRNFLKFETHIVFGTHLCKIKMADIIAVGAGVQHVMTVSDSDSTSDVMNEQEQTRETILMNELLKYYSEKHESLTVVVNIITEESTISLRVIDWFVTNYAKMNAEQLAVFFANTNCGGIYGDYKTQLKTFNKKLFDPFSRVSACSNLRRFPLHYNNGRNQIMTTVGQLNFFRWAIEAGVVRYIYQHLPDVKRAIKQSDRSRRKRHGHDATDSITSTMSCDSESHPISSTHSSGRTKHTDNTFFRQHLPTNFTISFG